MRFGHAEAYGYGWLGGVDWLAALVAVGAAALRFGGHGFALAIAARAFLRSPRVICASFMQNIGVWSLPE